MAAPVNRVVPTVAFAVAMALAGSAHASGFAQNTQSARAAAMAGAFTGVADSAAANFYNPAGLANLRGLNLEVGLTYLTSATSYTGIAPGTGGATAEVDAERAHLFLPNLHLAYNISGRVTLAFSVHMPYGASTRWPDRVDVGGAQVAWWGRGEARALSLDLSTFNPSVAVQLHPRVHLGLGFTAVRAALSMERAITRSTSLSDDVDLSLSGDGAAFGAAAGLLFVIIPDLIKVGVAYRSGVNITLEGEAAHTVGGSGAAVPASLRASLADGPVEVDLRLPHTFNLGLGFFPAEGFSVGVDVAVTTWSVNDALTVRFPDSPSQSRSDPQAWQNTFALRIGAEYEVLEDNLPLRLGFAYDQGPSPTSTLGPALPAGDRYRICVGAGYRLFGVAIDLAYQLDPGSGQSADASAPLPGTYHITDHLVGLSLGYTMDL